jgi:hypothetical protein
LSDVEIMHREASMRYTVLILAGVLVFAVACLDDDKLPFAPGATPMAEIDDGAHEGNEHFYFLPPMVDKPSYSGTFDGSLEPVVTICKWNLSDAECGPALDIYNVNTGPGSETVRVVFEDEHYIVNWRTDDILSTFPLEEGEVYRVRVLVDARELGHADVEVVDNGRELKNVETGEYIGLLDGKTLPIKFRIEEGALEQENPMVTAGERHSCGVTTSGNGYCWGPNGEGQLGAGFASDHEPTPVPVVGDHTFQSISAGWGHTCGLTTDGNAYCWGQNDFGQRGIGNTGGDEPTPQLVTGDYTFESVSAGWGLTCGLTTDGSAYCWGQNGRGQLGIGSTGGNEPAPQLVVGGHTFQTVSGGRDHTCAITTDGDAYCWGWNSRGQLGNGSTSGTEPVPQLVTDGHIFLPVNKPRCLPHLRNHHEWRCLLLGLQLVWPDRRRPRLV